LYTDIIVLFLAYNVVTTLSVAQSTLCRMAGYLASNKLDRMSK